MTEHALKPIARSTVVDAVTEQLREQILLGGFRPGQRLPAERDLAGTFGINRLTLRAALARLEAAGLIETQHGTGSVVRDYREHGGIETLPKLLQVSREGDPNVYITLVRDLLEVRRTIAAEVIAIAAERHTESDLIAIRAAAQAQNSRTENVVEFARGDLEFARTVVRAAKNLGLELLLNTIARFPDEDPFVATLMYPRPSLQVLHYEIVIGLIASRETAKARELMREALEKIDKLSLNKAKRLLKNTQNIESKTLTILPVIAKVKEINIDLNTENNQKNSSVNKVVKNERKNNKVLEELNETISTSDVKTKEEKKLKIKSHSRTKQPTGETKE